MIDSAKEHIKAKAAQERLKAKIPLLELQARTADQNKNDNIRTDRENEYAHRS